MRTYKVPSMLMNQLYAFVSETLRRQGNKETLLQNMGSEWTKDGRLFVVRVLNETESADKIHDLCSQAEKGRLRLAFPANTKSIHRWKEGDKINLPVELYSAVPYYGYFGFTTLYRFTDALGNFYEWVTSSGNDYERGSYNLQGRVKSNDVHDKVNVTTLNYVSLRKRDEDEK